MPLQLVRRIRHQAPFAAVFGLTVAACVYLLVQPHHWRRGSLVIGIAMVLAAGLRLALPRTAVGMLAVRGKWRDSFIYALLGVVIIVAVLRLG